MPSSIIVAALTTAVSAILPASIAGFAAQVLVGVLGSVLSSRGERKPRR